MLIYVAVGGDNATLERAEKITHDLQIQNPSNCYICPLIVFSHLDNLLNDDNVIDLRIDLLSVCDRLLIVSENHKHIECEIDFAELVGMEVVDLAKEEI